MIGLIGVYGVWHIQAYHSVTNSTKIDRLKEGRLD